MPELLKNKDIKIIMEFFPFLLKKMGSSPKVLLQKILDQKFKIEVIPHDYSDRKVGVEELMNIETDEHFNLYLHR